MAQGGPTRDRRVGREEAPPKPEHSRCRGAEDEQSGGIRGGLRARVNGGRNMRRLVFVLLLAVVLIALSMAAQGSAQAADNPYNMEIFLSHDNDQNVLHQNCPKVPADTAIVACTFVI